MKKRIYVEKRKNYPRVKEWRQRNPEKLAASQKRSFLRKAEIIRAAKAKPCMDCGTPYPYYVMHFDHVRGKKEFQVGTNMNAKSLPRLLAEIEKCDVVCANCHAMRTFSRKHWLNNSKTGEKT